MIKRAFAVELCGQAIGLESVGNLCRERWLAWCGVLHREQRSGKTAEIVPGARVFATADAQVLAFPVRGNDHDGAGCRQLGRQAGQCRAAGTWLQCQHGGTVGDKQAGEHEGCPEG
ncbi:hypothetical protein D3C78_1243050 [compost metagenome]